MSEKCSYHPTKAAWWQCDQCAKSLCPECIIQRKGGYLGNETLFLCPKCHLPAAALPAANMVEPFWQRLPRIFAYPFTSLQSILLILGLALLSTLFTRAGLSGLLFRFIPWALMIKYAFEALRHTAEGRYRPPPLTNAVLSENFGIVFKQIALFFLLILFFGLFVARLHPVFWMIFGLCVLVGLPAMIIILAINDNLGQALNPVYFLGMAARTGWGYLVLGFFLLLLLAAPGALGYAVIRHLPEGVQLFFWLAAQNYYTLVSYHLMGAFILQYHDRLDYPVDMETLLASTFPGGLPNSARSEQQNSAAAAEEALLQEAALLIQEGHLDEAIDLIEQRTKGDIAHLPLSERYLALLKMRGRDAAHEAHVPRHLDLLATSGERQKAVALYEACLAAKSPPAAAAGTLFKIAGWFNDKGDAKRAVQTYNQLTKNHPGDALIPKAYFRAAQILHEKLMHSDKARHVLNGLIARFPDHDIAGFARNYLKQM